MVAPASLHTCHLIELKARITGRENHQLVVAVGRTGAPESSGPLYAAALYDPAVAGVAALLCRALRLPDVGDAVDDLRTARRALHPKPWQGFLCHRAHHHGGSSAQPVDSPVRAQPQLR